MRHDLTSEKKQPRLNCRFASETNWKAAAQFRVCSRKVPVSKAVIGPG